MLAPAHILFPYVPVSRFPISRFPGFPFPARFPVSLFPVPGFPVPVSRFWSPVSLTFNLNVSANLNRYLINHIAINSKPDTLKPDIHAPSNHVPIKPLTGPLSPAPLN